MCPVAEPPNEEDWERSFRYLHFQPSVPPRLRELLRQYRLHPRKAFGQNFLVDDHVLERIVQAADLEPDDLVLEVGPGLGVLTQELARRVRRVVAVELDRDVAAALKRILAGQQNVEIVQEDILRFDPSERLGEQRYKVVANLPYYITSPTLRHFLEARAKPSLMVVMVQREVAERIVARPNDMSLLAVSVQVYGDPRLVMVVDPSSFYPPPKVESAVVRIDLFEKPAVDVDLEKFFRVVSAGFSQPRKQLHNTLSQAIWMPAGAAKEALTEAGIDPTRRAESLTVDEWARLTRALERKGLV